MRGPQSQIGLFMNVVNVELKLGDSLRPPDAWLFPANPRNGAATRFELLQKQGAIAACYCRCAFSCDSLDSCMVELF